MPYQCKSDRRKQLFDRDYLKILKANKIDFETIANNEALLITDNSYEKLKYDWSKFPIKKLELTEHEKKLKEMVQSRKNS